MSINYFNPFFSVKVMDGLFICNQTAVKDQQFIMNNKFSLIVNTCPRQFKVVSVQNVYNVTNFHWVNSKNQLAQTININMFKSIFQQITSNLQEGHGTLIVSERGHSRSITFVLLYLMDKFGWQLFKSLEYINSKRQNLSVRATYLKLLVGYEKLIKGQSLQNNKIIQNEDIPNHIKSTKQQKWSQQNIKCQYQKLITNTFKNTIKKRHINDINLEYRQKINTMMQNEKRLSLTVNTRDRHNENISKKRGKSVQFSNQIEIIIGESQITHNFPQYEQLKSQAENKKLENNRSTTFSHRQQRSLHSPNKEITNNRPSTRTQQIPPQQSLSNKQLFSNSRLINVRRMQQKNVKQQQQKLKNNHIIQLHNNDIYDNQFYEGQQQNVQSMFGGQKSVSISSQLQPYHQNNQYLPLDSFIKDPLERKNNSTDKQINIGGLSEKITVEKNKEYNVSKKTRLTSYKKLKASILQNQFKFNNSPIKKQHHNKQQRTQTQPKYDLQIDNLSNRSRFKKPIDRRLSSTQNDSMMRVRFGSNDLSQQRKSLSSALGMKTMSKIQKMNYSNSNGKQKRCQTPQLGVSQSLLINNQSISSHNNLINRPLSRGKSNSVRVNKKTSPNPISQNKQPQTTNIFNVNINVNIGKLQMFNNNTNNTQQLSSSSTTKNGLNNKQKLFKNLSQIDKLSLINSRPRSNSSNQNYSKYSICSGMSDNIIDNKNNNNNKETERGNKFLQHHQVGKNNTQKKQSLLNKNIVNKNLSTFHSSAFSMDQLNIGSCEAFTKQQIINKINKKLIHNNHNKHQHQQLFKNHTIKQNNFM